MFQFRNQAGTSWPNLLPLEAAAVKSAFDALEQTQWLSSAEIESGQISQFQTLWRHCLDHCPHYQPYGDVAPEHIRSLDDLGKLPILTRRMVQENASSIQATKLPAGVVQTGTVKTTGSAGVPLEIVQTNVVNLWWLAFFLRDTQWCGLDLSGTMASIRAFHQSGEIHQRLLAGVERNEWSPGLKTMIDTGPSLAMDVGQDPRRQLAWLQENQPDYLTTTATNLAMLASLAKEGGERVQSLRCLLSIGESLTMEAAQEIESAFGVPVKDVYSCSEVGFIASTCPTGDGLHVHAENVIVEVLDENGDRCGPGQTGRVVLTTLQNFQMPLVRYQIDDWATIATHDCGCGRKLPLLKGVQGKQRPFFVLPDGRRLNSGVVIPKVRAVGGHHQHQVIQLAVDEVLIRIVPDRTWTEQHASQLQRLFEQFWEAPVTVQLELVDRIIAGPGGKLQGVVVRA